MRVEHYEPSQAESVRGSNEAPDAALFDPNQAGKESDGPVRLLWIHGWGMSPQVWAEASQALPDAEHIYFTYADALSMDEAKQQLRASMNAMKAEEGRTILVAWSLGAVMALELLLDGGLPCDCEALITIGATLRFVSRERNRGWPERVVRRMLRQCERNPEQTKADFAVSMLTEAERAVWEPAMLEMAEHTDFTESLLRDGLEYLMETDLSKRWNEFVRVPQTGWNDQSAVKQHCPIFWIHGENDSICPPGAAPSDSTQRIIIPGGHAPLITKQELFYDTVRSLVYGH